MDTQNKPLIIGITGPFGSGKSTASNFFEKNGFTKIRLSEFLERKLSEKGEQITRRGLQDLGDSLREAEGSQALANLAIEDFQSRGPSKIVIDGIRNLGEIDAFKESFQFILLGVVADRDVRFERIKQMKGRESLDRKLFDDLDFRDLGITEDTPTGLQVAKCLAVSDYFIDSNRGYEEFEKDLEEFYKKI